MSAADLQEVDLQRLGYKVLAHCCCGVSDPLPGLLLERATKLHADRQQGGDATTPTGVLYIKCLGDCCKDRPLELHATGGCIFSGNAFEAHAGRQGRKKWRETIRVLPQNISLKAWLSSVGREYNRADSDNERQQHSPDAQRDGFVHAALTAAAAAAAAGQDPLGGAGSAAGPLWHAGQPQAAPLLKQMAAVGGLPGAAGLNPGAVPSGLLQALLGQGQHAPPITAGSPGLAGLSAALPPGLASLLQHGGPADAAVQAAAVAAAARQHAEGGGESAALQDAAVLQALSGLVRQLQHAAAGSQQEQPLPQQPPALAAALAAAAAGGEQQRGPQDGHLMEVLISVVQQLAAQREQLQEQQAQLAAQAQQISALTAQVTSQAEQLAAARTSLQGASAARLRQAEQLSLQARQQQELWGAVQALQAAVQGITGAPLPKGAAPAGPLPESHAAHPAGDTVTPAAILRVLSGEAPAQQSQLNNSTHGGAPHGVAPAAGLHQLQAMLAAMAAMSRQQHPQQHHQQPHHHQHHHNPSRSQQPSPAPLQHPQHQHHQHPQPKSQPASQPASPLAARQQQQQQVPHSPRAQQQQQQQAAAAEEGLGSQPGSGAIAGLPAGEPAGEQAPQGEPPMHTAGSGSPSRKRPRANSHDDNP